MEKEGIQNKLRPLFFAIQQTTFLTFGDISSKIVVVKLRVKEATLQVTPSIGRVKGIR
jgi:hypothetical protein